MRLMVACREGGGSVALDGAIDRGRRHQRIRRRGPRGDRGGGRQAGPLRADAGRPGPAGGHLPPDPQPEGRVGLPWPDAVADRDPCRRERAGPLSRRDAGGGRDVGHRHPRRGGRGPRRDRGAGGHRRRTRRRRPRPDRAAGPYPCGRQHPGGACARRVAPPAGPGGRRGHAGRRLRRRAGGSGHGPRHRPPLRRHRPRPGASGMARGPVRRGPGHGGARRLAACSGRDLRRGPGVA